MSRYECQLLPGASTWAGGPPVDPEVTVAELLDLCSEEPVNFDEILRHPARHRPYFLSALLHYLDISRVTSLEPSPEGADVALQLTAEIPAFHPRRQRLWVRARALLGWGYVQRQLNRFNEAESAFIAAIELFSELGEVGERRILTTLGYWAALEARRERWDRLARVVDEGTRLANVTERGFDSSELLVFWNGALEPPISIDSIKVLAAALYEGFCRCASTTRPPILPRIRIADETLDLYFRDPLSEEDDDLGWRLARSWSTVVPPIHVPEIPASTHER